MHIYLDDHPLDAAVDSIGDALDAAATAASAQGRLVVDVVVDGTAWSQTQLSSPDERARAADQVRVTTADRRALVLEAIDDAATALLHADELHREAAEHLQRDETASAMRHLQDALAVWSTVREVLSHATEATGVRLEEVDGAGAVPRLARHLEAIHHAIADSDPVGLADTLLYDLADSVVEWRGLLDAMREHLAS